MNTPPSAFSFAAAKLLAIDSSAAGGVFLAYKDDFAGFCRDILGTAVYPDPRPADRKAPYIFKHQLEIAQSVMEHERTAVASCHSAGKDFTAARIIVWFLCTRKNCKILTSAPTQLQVKMLLWGEISKTFKTSKVKLPGVLNQLQWDIDADHFALGFKSEDTKPERFAGYHADSILYVLDEASGMHDLIWEAVEGAMASGEGAHILAISNPTKASGQFWKIYHEPGERENWNTIQISAYDTPNFQPDVLQAWIDEGKPKQYPWPAPTINPNWVDGREKAWGKDDLRFKVRVLGEFPDEDTDVLIPRTWVKRAQEARTEKRISDLYTVEMGVDVGHMGDDESVVVIRQGPRFLHMEAWKKKDLMETSGRILNLLKEWNVRIVRIDAIGLGAGVPDRLWELQNEGAIPPNVEIVAFKVSRSPENTEEFRSLRDEMYELFRQRFRNEAITDLPTDAILEDQIGSIRYGISSRGQQYIESKAELKKRGGDSPDRMEAAMLAYHGPDNVAGGKWDGEQDFDDEDEAEEYFGNVFKREF